MCNVYIVYLHGFINVTKTEERESTSLHSMHARNLLIDAK